MGFSVFSSQTSPIAIDFGSAAVKMLQIGKGEPPALLAAAAIPVPDVVRSESSRQFPFYCEWLPKVLTDANFKGRRAVIAIPTGQTIIQHMQLAETEGISRDDLVKAQLQSQFGGSPLNVVVRSLEVGPVNRDGQVRTEVICFAIGRDTVMRYVELLRKCKVEVVGVHTETIAMVRAFDHLNRRKEDAAVTTVYVDLGWSGTRVVITHGKDIMFTRSIAMGGRNFDEMIAKARHCDIATARSLRLSSQASMKAAQPADAESVRAPAVAVGTARASAENGEPAFAAGTATATKSVSATKAPLAERRVGLIPPELNHPFVPTNAIKTGLNVDVTELLDVMSDELSMCIRYHQGLFRNRPINRLIFLGGESRQEWLCQHVVNVMRVPAHMGDPLARYDQTAMGQTPGVNLREPQPGWAVVCGLCTAPTDL